MNSSGYEINDDQRQSSEISSRKPRPESNLIITDKKFRSPLGEIACFDKVSDETTPGKTTPERSKLQEKNP